jgi:hypothetical protein
MADNANEGDFAVSRIVGMRVVRAGLEFQVEWEPNWIPERLLDRCCLFVESFRQAARVSPIEQEFSDWDYYVSCPMNNVLNSPLGAGWQPCPKAARTMNLKHEVLKARELLLRKNLDTG